MFANQFGKLSRVPTLLPPKESVRMLRHGSSVKEPAIRLKSEQTTERLPEEPSHRPLALKVYEPSYVGS